jgi:ribosomal protein L13E
MRTLKRRKKEKYSEFTVQMKLTRGEMSLLAKEIKSKRETREVKCETHLDMPNAGMKQTIRLDTNEVVRTERMGQAELQANMFAGAPN